MGKENEPVFIESSCVYCGCGCRLNYEVKDNKIVKVRGVKRDDVSDGAPCLKGLTIHEVFDKNRIEKPLSEPSIPPGTLLPKLQKHGGKKSEHAIQ